MAVAPLFVADAATLKSELRLSGLAASSDGEQILARGMSSARIGLYRRLGVTKVTELVGQADVDNPTTTAQVIRKAATLVEVEWVRMELLQTMPVIVADASGDAQQLYNDEGVWRDVSPDELAEMLRRIEDGIEELLELILGLDELGDDLSINVYSGGRGTDADTVAYPGGTLWPTINKFTGNYGEQFIYGGTVIPVRFQLPPD